MTGTTTEVARECVSIRGALVVQPANESTTGVLTEATRYASMEAYTQVGHDGWNLPMPGDALSPGTVSWASSPVWCSSQPGIGDDNPVVPNELTGVRLARAVMAELQNTSSIVVRHAILGCCATGRNFVFAGYAPCGASSIVYLLRGASDLTPLRQCL